MTIAALGVPNPVDVKSVVPLPVAVSVALTTATFWAIYAMPNSERQVASLTIRPVSAQIASACTRSR